LSSSSAQVGKGIAISFRSSKDHAAIAAAGFLTC